MGLSKLGQIPSHENLRWARAKALEILDSIPSHGLILEAYLFGSAARGLFGDDSDFDFLIVAPDQDSCRKLQKEVYTVKFADVPIDWIFKTQQEFEDRKNMGGVCFVAFREGLRLR